MFFVSSDCFVFASTSESHKKKSKIKIFVQVSRLSFGCQKSKQAETLSFLRYTLESAAVSVILNTLAELFFAENENKNTLDTKSLLR
jgi:hypothetical protein